MPNLHPIDISVIVIYLAGITLLGTWIGRKVKQAGEFFMPRRFGKTMMIMHAFGTGTASDQAVTVSSATFRSGLSGIWYQWLWLFVTPFYWLIAPIFRRFRAITTADVYELRFDRSVAILFALVGIANMCIKIGLMLKGASVLIDSSSGGLIDSNVAIVGLTIMFVTYGAAGGLAAAIVTDYFQGILTIVFSFMLLPFIFSAVGGMEGIRQTVTNPDMLSLVAPGKVTVFFIIMMSVQALAGIVAQPFIMGVCAAGKTEWEGRVGIVVGNIIKRFCTAAWTLTAIAAVAWYLQKNIDLATVEPDYIYGNVAQAFLPNIMPGLLGLFLAATLAGVMSSCDSFMISSSGLFTENIYKIWFPQKSELHYLWIGRIVAILIVAGGLIFAFWVPSIVKALEIWFMIAPMMGLVFWIGLIWRRMTVAGAWATTVTGFFIWWVTNQNWFIGWVAGFPLSGPMRLIWIEKGEAVIYLPWQILAYMTAASITGIIVSLLTKPVSKSKLDRFYDLTRTPVLPGEQIERPCMLPEGVVPPDRQMLIQSFGLEIPVPSKATVIGFAMAWAGVGILIAAFVGFVWH